MKSFGCFSKRILIVGSSPCEIDDKKGMPWQGKTGRILKQTLDELGIDLFNDCASIHAVHCRTAGGTDWKTVVDLGDTTSPNTGHIIQDSFVRATSSVISIDRADKCLVSNMEIQGTGLGALGIVLNPGGPVGTEGNSLIVGCHVDLCQTSYQVNGTAITIRDCGSFNAIRGIQMLASGGSQITVENTRVVLDATDTASGGIEGMVFYGTEVRVSDCHIENPRAAWTTTLTDSIGIHFETGSAEASVENCKIIGFRNTTATANAGIYFGDGCGQSKVTGCVITNTDRGISTPLGNAHQLKVSDCVVSEVQFGADLEGIQMALSDNTFALDVNRGESGILLTNGVQSVIEGCQIISARTVYAAEDPAGIHLDSCGNSSITGCFISNFRNPGVGIGEGILLDSSPGTKIQGCHINEAPVGIDILANSANVQVDACAAFNVDRGVRAYGDRGLVSDSQLELDNITGLFGVDAAGAECKVQDNIIENTRVAWAAPASTIGIRLAGIDSSASGNRVKGFYNSFPSFVANLIVSFL